MDQEFSKDKVAPEVWAKAEGAFNSFMEWVNRNNFELVTMEVPCISEALQYGTTVDIVARVNGNLALVEVKTSNSVHEDYVMQLAAQKYAWDETHDEKIAEFHLLRLGKEEANFVHHFWLNLDKAMEAFKHLRALHDLKKELKKLI